MAYVLEASLEKLAPMRIAVEVSPVVLLEPRQFLPLVSPRVLACFLLG